MAIPPDFKETLESARTELGKPVAAALDGAPAAPPAGQTVFGAPVENVFAEDPARRGQTVLGAPIAEALAASESFEKGFTVLGGAPPPDALASPAAYPAGHTEIRAGDTDFGGPPSWDLRAAAAPADAPRELARAKQLHREGVAMGKAGQLALADARLRESLDLRRRYCAAGDVEIANGCVSLGTLYFFGHRPDLAEPLYREAWSLYRQGLGDRHPDTATRAIELARVLHMLGRPQEAYGFLRGAHEVYSGALGPMHPATTGALDLLRYLFR